MSGTVRPAFAVFSNTSRPVGLLQSRLCGGPSSAWLGLAACLLVAAGAPAMACVGASQPDEIDEGRFRTPPAAARPHVVWHWTDDAMTREGITADLELMKRAAVGGALIVGAPASGRATNGGVPAVRPADEEQPLLTHAVAQANRLGLQLGIEETAIPPCDPDESLNWRSYRFLGDGERRLVVNLAPPPGAERGYRDLAVLACPMPPPVAEPLAPTPWLPSPAWERDRTIDLTPNMTAAGRLEWVAPKGFWQVLRIGAGPATDWTSRAPNWPHNFREAFKLRRGYDPTPFLPIAVGRADANPEIAQRFRWDMRTALVEDRLEGQGLRRQEAARRLGLELAVVVAEGTARKPRLAPLDVAAAGDMPVAMLRIDGPDDTECRPCAWAGAAAHANGKPVAAARVVAAWSAGRDALWEEAWARTRVHAALCAGVNRIYLPSLPRSSSATDSREWLTQLARCQYLLQCGQPVVDFCRLDVADAGEAELCCDLAGHSCDTLSARVVQQRLRVENGLLALPEGIRYRAIVLPKTGQITPQSLQTIVAMVRQGATAAVTARPVASPGLQGHPACDQEVVMLAKQLCGEATPPATGFMEVACGKGRVLLLARLEELPAAIGVRPDLTFEASDAATRLRWTRRRSADAAIYFVANAGAGVAKGACSLDGSLGTPELWNPHTGIVERPAESRMEAGRMLVPLTIGPNEAMFIVVRRPSSVR